MRNLFLGVVLTTAATIGHAGEGMWLPHQLPKISQALNRAGLETPAENFAVQFRVHDGLTVEIEEFKRDEGLLRIGAVIYVERKGQKKIIIGEKGARLRSIGSEARRDMESLFDSRVMLRLWVKVKSGWSDDERALRSLGYDDV